MPLRITDGCINCDACVPVCPSHGISKGDSVYVIDQDACSECVGFFSEPQCASVCPMDSCVINVNDVMTEEALFARALAVHADSGQQPTLTAETSHFQKAAAKKLRKAATKKRKRVSGRWWERLHRRVVVDG